MIPHEFTLTGVDQEQLYKLIKKEVNKAVDSTIPRNREFIEGRTKKALEEYEKNKNSILEDLIRSACMRLENKFELGANINAIKSIYKDDINALQAIICSVSANVQAKEARITELERKLEELSRQLAFKGIFI